MNNSPMYVDKQHRLANFGGGRFVLSHEKRTEAPEITRLSKLATWSDDKPFRVTFASNEFETEKRRIASNLLKAFRYNRLYSSYLLDLIDEKEFNQQSESLILEPVTVKNLNKAKVSLAAISDLFPGAEISVEEFAVLLNVDENCVEQTFLPFID